MDKIYEKNRFKMKIVLDGVEIIENIISKQNQLKSVTDFFVEYNHKS